LFSDFAKAASTLILHIFGGGAIHFVALLTELT
jgi:hypothetical protein